MTAARLVPGILAPALPVSTIKAVAGSGVDCLRVTCGPPPVMITFRGSSKSRVLYRLFSSASLAEISILASQARSQANGTCKSARAGSGVGASELIGFKTLKLHPAPSHGPIMQG